MRNPRLRIMIVCAVILLVLSGVYSNTLAAQTPSVGTLAIIVGQVGGSTGMGNEVYVLNTDGKNGKSLKKFGDTSSAEFTKVAWSPDGNHLAFYSINPPGLTVVDPDGGNPQVNPVASFVFAWTPDGTQITFPQQGPSNWTINNVSLDGMNIQTLFTVKNMSYIDYIRWSPDGKWLAYVGTPAGNKTNGEELHIIDAAGNNDRVIVPAGTIEQNAMWSPDSTKIAYISDDRSTGTGLWLADVSDKSSPVGIAQQIASQAVAADWSPDGSQFVYATRDGQLFVMNANDLKPQQIQRPADLQGQIVAIAWRPTGNPNAPVATSSSSGAATEEASGPVTIPAEVQASLTETFTAKDKSFSFKYPKAWGAPQETSSGASSSTGADIRFMSAIPTVEILVLPTAIASALGGSIGPGLKKSTLQSNGRSVTVFEGVSSTTGGAYMIAYEIDLGNGLVAIMVSLAPNAASADPVKPTLQAVVASFQAPAAS